MTNIALVACSKDKLNCDAAAQDMYQTRLFVIRKQIAERDFDAWFILSSKYGLVHPFDVISPYEDWMQKWLKAKRVNWQLNILEALQIVEFDSITIHAGKAYYDPVLEAGLRERGANVSIPTRGMTALTTYSYLKTEVL